MGYARDIWSEFNIRIDNYKPEDILLMGQSVLKKHNVNGTKYAPYGYWSLREEDGFACRCE